MTYYTFKVETDVQSAEQAEAFYAEGKHDYLQYVTIVNVCNFATISASTQSRAK